jgi:MerR family transcriptional regulator/heat shock protein HspR
MSERATDRGGERSGPGATEERDGRVGAVRAQRASERPWGREPQASGGDRGLFVISVAAELAGVHPQTLRIYERKGLISPARTSGRSRRYSERDIALLRRIQELTNEGVGLAGVERILEMEVRLAEAHERIAALERELADALRRVAETAEAVHRGYRRELVPLPSTALVRTSPRRS